MCGIIGLLSYKKEAENINMKGPVEKLSHRGPDDNGQYSTRDVFMGHRRLSIIDLKTGRQPMINEDESVVLIFNGEIYNYKELRDDLIAKGRSFKTKSDSEVVLRAYEEYGIDKAISFFNGMFAFAIWDKRRTSFIIARDRLGIKPLYFTKNSRFLAVASEPKSLFLLEGAEKEINSEVLFEYFTSHEVSGERTFFKSVRKAEPGYFYVFTPDGKEKKTRYWELDEVFTRALNIESEKEALRLIDRGLEKSVDYRLTADVPVGVLLSGGIDSSLISYYVSRSTHKNAGAVKLYNAGNANKEIDESPYARTQADFLKDVLGHVPELESFVIGNTALLDMFSYLTYIYDEPIQFQSSGFIYDICARSKANGTKVLLVGEGSDELFLGYERFWRTLSNIGRKKYPAYSDEELIYYGGGIDNAELVKRLTKSSPDALNGTAAFRWLVKKRNLRLRERIMLYSIAWRLQSVLMRMDRMSMASGVEVRVPFLDHRFIESVIGIDMEVKAPGREPKHLIKVLAQGKVSPDIIERKKLGSPSDIAYWLKQEAARKALSSLTEAEDSLSKNHLDHNTVKEIISAHFGGARRYDVLIWMLFSLEMWNRVLKEPESAINKTPHEPVRIIQ